MQLRCIQLARSVIQTLLLLVLSFLATPSSAGAQEPGTTGPLALYQTALNSLEADRYQRFAELASRLRAFPLYPYLRYAEIQHRLESVSPSTVTSYIEHYPELPVTPVLRNAWLRELARRQDWPEFLASYQGERNVYLRCALVQAKFATGEKDQAIAVARELWHVGYRQPQSCNPAFDLLERSGELPPGQIEERILLALRAGHDRLAAELLQRLPGTERTRATHWLELYHHPETSLQSRYGAPGSDPAEPPVLAAAISHLALDHPAKAHLLWAKIQARHVWGKAVADSVERTIALHAAYNDLPQAGDWLRMLPAASKNALVHAWRVRNALRRGDWELVAQSIAAMPGDQRNIPVWRYWQARSMEQLGRGKEARRLYRTLAGHFCYYGFLAADALDTPYHWGKAMPSADPARKRALSAQPAVQRALLLHKANQHELAQLEWRVFIRGLKVRDRLTAARIAAEQSWPWATLYAAALAGIDNASLLHFPKGYLKDVHRSARHTDIDPAWLFALLRQESAFRRSSCSHAGACGVMQLMPATARWVLERNGNDPSDIVTTLSEPSSNIAAGADYLAYLRSRFSSHILALAAYNAGPGNLSDWLSEEKGPPLGSARWIETLLYGETREYLKSVLFNEVVYRLRLNNRTTRLSQLLKKERAKYSQTVLETLAKEQP